MDVFSDSSKWFDYGTRSALPTWQLFSSGTFGSSLFEVTFSLDWDAWNNPEDVRFKSYCWLRFYYRKDGLFTVTEQARKIYLQPESQVIEMPVPSRIQGYESIPGYVIRVPGFRYQTFHPSAMKTPEAVFPWSLTLRSLGNS
ncbi:MAG TPA: hypothetical protein VK211_08775 [Kamptonema sp.]|nr:hypothetical protein [Kamptonema sp.]